MMKGKKNTGFAAFLATHLLLVMTGTAQENVALKYPQGYFRNPLGIPMAITANFGELRPNHWHMGLDLRTNQRENYPVFAAAGGFIRHVGIRPLSFGRYIIIDHANGFSTLYAHLNEFFPALEQYVRSQQNKKESWAIELDMDKDRFPVKRGDTIARSGNTGGSQGPHLHFEIRETKTGRSLNPLLFGFEIKDDIPPVITRLAMYNRNVSTHEQTPVLINAKKTDSGYYTVPQKMLTGFKKISFAIGAYDRVNGSTTPDGIYNVIFYFDDKPRAEFLLDRIDYRESVFINAHIDYRYRFNGGPYLQHLSKLPGDPGIVYHDTEGGGIVELTDTLEHRVRIEVMDAYDNLSELFFTVQYNDSLAALVTTQNIFKKFFPGQINVFEEKDFEVYLPENCLYDTVPQLYFIQNNFLPDALSAVHRLSEPSYPVHENIVIRIKPTVAVSDSQKVLLVREWQGQRSVKKAEWQKGWLSASFGDFGNFQAFIDLLPPLAAPPVKEKDTLDFSPLSKIVFTPTDNFGIKSFRAEINGIWRVFSNDKARSYVYLFDESFPFGIYELKVRIEDLVGNVTEKKWWFKRYPYKPPQKKKVSKKKKKKPAKSP